MKKSDEEMTEHSSCQVRGVSDSMLTVTLQLNEPGTAYCVALSRGQAWRCEKVSSLRERERESG